MAACLLEILLMYTGYIRHMLHLVDFSEAPAFLIGPALYLMVVSLIRGQVWFFWHPGISIGELKNLMLL